jgi:hypothetical protein
VIKHTFNSGYSDSVTASTETVSELIDLPVCLHSEYPSTFRYMPIHHAELQLMQIRQYNGDSCIPIICFFKESLYVQRLDPLRTNAYSRSKIRDRSINLARIHCSQESHREAMTEEVDVNTLRNTLAFLSNHKPQTTKMTELLNAFLLALATLLRARSHHDMKVSLRFGARWCQP